ncbi:MAG: MATE family efflux transporter [Candidatus Gastranaerophilales bacterium]|nr:MATE family efflux transporter [Candidatus Gastranaerophilales bacterium]
MQIFKNFVEQYKKYTVELLKLAAPLAVGHLGLMLIGATDVFVAAKHSIETLAAISIANSIIFTIFIMGIGLLASISIMLSNYRGARKFTKKFFQTSMFYTLVLATLFCFITLSIIPFIDIMGFATNLVPMIKQYMFISAFSFFGMYIYQGTKEFLQAHEIVHFPNMILIGAVFVNLIMDFAFVFGIGPIPSMGEVGLALSTFIVRTLMGLAMIIYCRRLFDFKTNINLDFAKKLLRIGSPIGLALLLEFFAFNLITILVGRDASILAATHNIITTITSSTFMVPLAISNAISIKVGFCNGAKNYPEIRNYSIAGTVMGITVMGLCAAALISYPAFFIKIFTQSTEILKIATPIIIIAGLFQISDGFQVTVGGILKGLKMTKTVSVCVLGGYWLVGLPLGIILAYPFCYSLKGFWIGLAVSLTLIGLVESIIVALKFKKIKAEYK